MKTFLILATTLFAISTFATEIVAVGGASNSFLGKAGKATTVYYSNITDKLDITTLYYVGDPQGGTCSTTINENCKTALDVFSLSVQLGELPKGRANVHLIYSQTRPSANQSLDTLTHVAAWRVGSKLRPVTFNTTWGNLCNTVFNSPTPVADLGPQCQDQGLLLGNHSLWLWIVVDKTDSNLVGTDVTPLNVTFASSIAVTTSGGLGLYDFKVVAGKTSVDLTSLTGDMIYPFLTNGIGAWKTRLYYAKASDPTSMVHFNDVGPTAASSQHADVVVNSNGSFQTHFDGLIAGETYYFRIATVDRAGNVGLLTVDDNADRVALVLP